MPMKMSIYGCGFHFNLGPVPYFVRVGVSINTKPHFLCSSPVRGGVVPTGSTSPILLKGVDSGLITDAWVVPKGKFQTKTE